MVTSHEEGNSEFRCHMQRVKDEAEVQNGLMKMKIKYGDATHIVTAYRLQGANGPFRQDFLDDGEAGVGRSMMEMIQEKKSENIAVYVARYYGGVKLGKRFEIYKELAKKAAKLLQVKLNKLQRVNRLYHSNSQSSQLSIASQFSQEGATGDELEFEQLNDQPQEQINLEHEEEAS